MRRHARNRKQQLPPSPVAGLVRRVLAVGELDHVDRMSGRDRALGRPGQDLVDVIAYVTTTFGS